MTSAISEEEENGLRLRLLIEKAEEVLRTKFHQYFPTNPSNLYNKLSNNKNKNAIQKLVKKKIIHQDQLDVLLPVNFLTDSAKFDLTLLTLLLRSLCNLKVPVTGWTDAPLLSDSSDAANLVRIRIARNKLQHGNLKYQEPYFTNFWNDICGPLIALGCNNQELVDMKIVSLDPLSQQQLKQIRNKLQITMQQVSDLEDSLDGVTYNLLPTNPSFVGRNASITEMHNELVSKDDNKLAVVISGLGGVGKTEIVRQYCHQHISYYKNNIIWINAEQENSIASDFINVAEQINLTIKDEGGKYIGTKAIIAKVYNYFAGHPVLFVFDNIIDNKSIIDVISGSYLSNPSFILTTQMANWSQRFIVKKLDMLSIESACIFLKNELSEKHTINDDFVKDLCEKVQCLPLALQQSVAYIKQCALTIVEYIEEFDLHTEYVLSNTVEDEAYFKTIATTWSMALRKIREHQDSEFIISFLGMLSYLDGKDINKKVFTLATDKFQVNKAITVLQQYSLISVFTNTENLDQSIHIHSLVQMAVKLEPENKSQSFLKHLLQILFKSKRSKQFIQIDYGLYWWNQLVYIFIKEQNNELVIGKIYENNELLYEVVEANAQWGIFIRMLSLSDEMKYKLALPILKYYKGKGMIACCVQNQGKYNEALKMFLDIEKTILDIIDSKHKDYLTLSIKIALCVQQLGEFEIAIKRYFDIEEIAKEVFGENHPFYFGLQGHIGTCLISQGKYDIALQTLLKVEKSALETFGEDNPDFLTLQNNIALCLTYQGKYEIALKKYLDIEKLTIQTLGADHPCCAMLQNNIASCYDLKEEFDLALPRYLESERISLRTVGAKHPNILLVRSNIGLCHMKKGNFDLALSMYLDIEESTLEILGPKHPQFLRLRNNIAGCFQNLNKIDCALKQYLEIEKSMLEVLGSIHPDVLTTQNNIALCYKQQGNFELALKKHLEVEKLASETLGNQHLFTVKVQIQIADCFDAQNNLDMALEKYLKAEKSCLTVPGPKHPEFVMVRNSIGLCHIDKGNYDEALEIFLDIEKNALEMFHPKHPQLLMVRNNIGLCLQHQCKFDCALKQHLEIEESMLEELGPKHPDFLKAQHNIALCYQQLGKFEIALKKQLEIEKTALETLGNQNLITLNIENHIANCFEGQRNYDMAFKKYLEVEKSILKLLGPNHPDSIMVRNSIGSCHVNKGNYDAALEIFLDIDKNALDMIGPRKSLIVQSNIGLCFQKQNKTEFALKKYFEVEKCALELVGPKDPFVLTVQNNIGKCLLLEEKFKMALNKFREVEIFASKIFRSDHPNLEKLKTDITFCLNKLDDSKGNDQIPEHTCILF